MERDVHRVTMVQPPAIVNRALPEDRYRQLLFERVREEPLNLPGLAQAPTGSSYEANKGAGSHETLPCESKILGDSLLGFGLHKYRCNLRIRFFQLMSRAVQFVLRFVYRKFILF